MDRRDFLKLSGSAALISLVSHVNLKAADLNTPQILAFREAAYNGQLIQGGWLQDPQVARYFTRDRTNPYLKQVNQEIRGTGKGQIALLWPFLEQCTGGPLVPHLQEIGDCVSHGYGLGVDILTACQIIKKNSAQRWVAPAATEIIYGGGRIEVAKQLYKKEWWGDGMTGTVAAEFLVRFGALLRQTYLNKWDFTQYDGNVARTFGQKGVPDALEPLCKVHPIGSVTLATSWEEARDCIYNGYPVTLCSSQGFNTRRGRDRDGFLAPSRNPWMHCMLLAGMDDSTDRPGGLIINSWGSTWVSGPTRHNQPAGSFWADASVIDRICKQGDSIALSCYAGYPRQDYLLW
jgi:hypothetical protein